ncbi:MAG TPA: hypothetical protein VMP01_09335 [Pirellulaceae bacterium]|nr:hypothetical protein [Pirellulaceae bacterium]
MTAIRILLTVVFCWSFFKTASILVRNDSMDLLLLTSAGLGWSFWILVPAIGILLAGALVYVWRPSPTLYRIAQAAVVLSVVETALASLVAIGNPQAAKDAFVASRTGRGLPVREEVLRMMDAPASHLLPLLFAVLLAGVWLLLLYLVERQRRQAAADGELP